MISSLSSVILFLRFKRRRRAKADSITGRNGTDVVVHVNARYVLFNASFKEREQLGYQIMYLKKKIFNSNLFLC
uniref:Bm1571 n=1 Tax=Brugia malayi TaxID=6279 RepID=A0A1I9G703_BRUMA|nr:Bm1571 [Brugia malayi]